MTKMYIPKGVQEASDILNKSTKYMVYGDPDVDGLVAMSLVMQMLQYYGKEYCYYINENRAHGFLLPLEKLEELKGYTIIAVDFSISNEVLKQIVDMGLNIINIDHHDTKNEELFVYENNGYSGVLINNQYCFEPKEQRFLSGAGMVFYTFLPILPEFMRTERNIALVGITLLSDVREIENNEAEKFLTVLYNWEDTYSRYLINLVKNKTNYTFGAQKHLDRQFVDFQFSPKFNALFRMNMGDIAIQLFNKVPVQIDLTDVKVMQTSVSDLLLTRVSRVYESETFNAYSVDLRGLEPRDFKYTNLIGLLCSSTLNEDDKTVFVYAIGENGVERGSVRGRYDEVDYLSIFNKIGGITAAGHKTAFGVYCESVNIPFDEIERQIKVCEVSDEVKDKHNKRIIPCTNLRIASNVAKQVAEYNIYVRNLRRKVFDCSTCDYTIKYENETKTCTKYSINGVEVVCFKEGLTPENGYVMPLLVDGYIQYYLQKL